jgi:hypothetical protein
MGQRIIVGKEQGSDREVAVLFDSTSGWAFGPVIEEDDQGHSAEDQLEAFLAWLEDAAGGTDLRCMADAQVEQLMARWRATYA